MTSVAIVGPSSSLTKSENGKEIDSFDIVVRMKTFKIEYLSMIFYIKYVIYK